jgi:hypothetical protein
VGESMKQQIPSVSRDILLSWVIGALIVLLLTVVREQGGAPQLTRTLLWPGLRLAHATGHSAHDIGIVLVIVGDSIVYGFFSFLILRVLRTILS